MNREDHKNAQLLRELQWLAHYFKEYSREDLAQEIFEQITKLRHRAQNSLHYGESAEIISLETHRSNKPQ